MNRHIPTFSNRAGSRRRGFSLIEVVVVIVVMAIVAVTAVPAMSSAQATRRRIAGRQMARDLNYARERSIATGTRHWVVINAAADTYTMLIENAANPGRANATAFTDPATGKAFSQALNAGEFAGVDIVSASIGGGAGSEVGFDWLGSPYDSTEAALSAAGTITLSGSQTVTIEPGTGLARLSP